MYQKPDYERAIQLVREARMHLAPLITHRFPFEQYLQAYHTIEEAQGQTMKAIIELE